MASLLAVLAGLAVGIGLALPPALRVRRRTRRQAEAQGSSARSPMLGTADQRRRVLWIAAVAAIVAVGAVAAGVPALGPPLLFLAIMLTGQTVLFAMIAQLREARSRAK